MHFRHLFNFLQFSSLIVSVALSNFHLVFFKFIENFFTTSLKLNIFVLSFRRASVAIHRCPSERLLIGAHARILTSVNTAMYIVAFTAVSYKRSHRKCWSEHICAHFQMCPSGKALTSILHLLRVGNLFLRRFMLTVNSCNRNRLNGPFIAT